MIIYEAIEQVLKDCNKSQRWLAGSIGKNSNSLNNILGRGTVSVELLYQICESLGYEITIQPKGKRGVRPTGQVVVEPGVRPKRGESGT